VKAYMFGIDRIELKPAAKASTGLKVPRDLAYLGKEKSKESSKWPK